MSSLSTSKEICARELEVLAKTQKLPYCPIAFKSGKGALLYDYEGKEYIDLLASASSANVGHGNEEIAEAVKEQMSKLAQFSIVYFSCKEPVEYAEKLIELYPGDNNKKVLFSTTGSESIDAAIKLAKGYTGRNKMFLCFFSGSIKSLLLLLYIWLIFSLVYGVYSLFIYNRWKAKHI